MTFSPLLGQLSSTEAYACNQFDKTLITINLAQVSLYAGTKGRRDSENTKKKYQEGMGDEMFHSFIFGALKWESELSQYFMLKTWKEARFCISLCGSQHSKGMEYEYFARFGKNSLKIVLCHHFQFTKVGKRSLSNIWK